MPRRKKAVKRQMLPDPKYNSVLAARFINTLLRKGKKSLAERIFYDAIELIQRRTDQEGMVVFQKAVENVKPIVEVRSRRVGGATYQVPVEVRSDRRTALSMRWVIVYAKARSEKTMAEKLAGELTAAANNEGAAMKRRDDTHRMAEANKAFAHYRW